MPLYRFFPILKEEMKTGLCCHSSNTQFEMNHGRELLTSLLDYSLTDNLVAAIGKIKIRELKIKEKLELEFLIL